MPVITAAELKRFAPKAGPHIVSAFVAYGDAAFLRWGIVTARRLQMFMAQVDVESGHESTLFENMNYTAARIHAVWPSRFPSVAAATPYAHNPQALANKVYGGRMGNVGPNDGWLCRGEGLLDTTGLANFEALAKHMGQTVEVTRARLTSDEGMVDCAAATFHMLGCLPFADKGDLIGCTRKVNGGLVGLTDRRQALARAVKVWPTMRAPVLPPAPTPGVPVALAADPLPSQSWTDWLGSLFHRAA